MANLGDIIHVIDSLIQAHRFVPTSHQWQEYASEMRLLHCGTSVGGYQPVHIGAISVL